jgi:DNA adenine methylase
MKQKVLNNNISFLRWAGSKKNLITEIRKYYPSKFNNYFEPFLGSASVFFDLNIRTNAFLSDTNEELINTYKQIRVNVDEIINFLNTYLLDKDFYYLMREKIPDTNVERAARFLYLNKTCFNGLYRVNKSDKFNVPYGHRINVDLVSEDLLRKISERLKNVEIEFQDFEYILPLVNEGDFVFLDPPYVVSHNKNGFIEYNKKIFSWKDQLRLKNLIEELDSRNINFILTNAAHNSIRELYSDISQPNVLKNRCKIGGKHAYRGLIEEFLFTNIK